MIFLGLIALAAAGWILVKHYDRHLANQIEPWIVAEMKPQRSQSPRDRRHNASSAD